MCMIFSMKLLKEFERNKICVISFLILQLFLTLNLEYDLPKGQWDSVNFHA